MYNVLAHGDILEKEASEFIRNRFPYYEKVWQIYTGNVGNATIAQLPQYREEKKRISFSEHSYTVLESCFIVQTILNTKDLSAEINSFKTYYEFNKALISFFAFLGRIHDTIIKAAQDLQINTKEIRHSLMEFYQARNIIIHGKRIPIVLDELGLGKMPILETERTRGIAWSDKGYGWADIGKLPIVYAEDNCEQYFNNLLHKINGIYAIFFDVISAELKSIPTSLQFTRLEIIDSSNMSGSIESSGTTNASADVYKTKESFKTNKGN